MHVKLLYIVDGRSTKAKTLLKLFFLRALPQSNACVGLSQAAVPAANGQYSG